MQNSNWMQEIFQELQASSNNNATTSIWMNITENHFNLRTKIIEGLESNGNTMVKVNRRERHLIRKLLWITGLWKLDLPETKETLRFLYFLKNMEVQGCLNTTSQQSEQPQQEDNNEEQSKVVNPTVVDKEVKKTKPGVNKYLTWLTLAELLDDLEQLGPIDICTEPPDDGNDTECDSAASDEDEANLNHLGPNLLPAKCEFRLRDDDVLDDTQEINEIDNPENIFGFIKKNLDFDSSDDEPLAKYQRPKKIEKPNRKKRKPKEGMEKKRPNFKINTNCAGKPISAEAKSSDTPLDFFKLFFTDDLLKHMLDQTNVYASQKNTNLNMNMDEMKAFIGGLLLSGYAKYPNKRMYWSGQEDIPKILQNNTRLNRFEQILRHFHLNATINIGKDGRLYKLRPLISKLNKHFKQHGGLEENFLIDESMIPYYSRHYAKQYIKGKPIRFGFKNWAFCTRSGYMTSLIYTLEKVTRKRSFWLGGDTVIYLIDLAEIPPNEGYKLFFDNYFSSVDLFEHLTENNYCATGTIQERRTANCPLLGKSELMKQDRGSYDFRTENKICLVKWKDNKVVTCATNFDLLGEGKCTRWSHEKKTEVSLTQPTLFAKYNCNVGGVDKIDQLVAVYRTRIRQQKWWWPIFCYLLDVCIVNAWLLMKKVHPTDKFCSSLLNFRSYIANALLSHGKPPARGKSIPNPTSDIRYDGRNHWPEYVPTERLCKFCGGKSKFICSKCQKRLHPKMCFKNYHTF